MSKRVAIYSRVSTERQTVANQVTELRAWAERCGHTVVAEYEDHAVSVPCGPRIGWAVRCRI
jgi:DNA invertase Pin-like site-specific DNA recombinase